MKKIILALFALSALAVGAHAQLVPGSWSYTTRTAYVGLVRQNISGFYFQVKTSDPSDASHIFGFANSHDNYHTMVSMILTAKAASLPIQFFVEANAGGPPYTAKGLSVDGTVKSVTALDIAP